MYVCLQSLKRSYDLKLKTLESTTAGAIAELNTHGLSQEGKTIIMVTRSCNLDHPQTLPLYESRQMNGGFQPSLTQTIYVALTKMRISCLFTAQLICAFVLTYAKSRFPHDTAHIVHLH